jgi:sugar phosphate isomerase/epimerase
MSSDFTLSVQSWSAFQHYQRQPLQYWPHLETIFTHYRSAGCPNWEGIVDNEEQLKLLTVALPQSGLRMPSAYMGGCFHEGDPEELRQGWIKRLQFARKLGARIIVCNPDPVSWSHLQQKSDAQLTRQLRAFQMLGECARDANLSLALHWHYPEFHSGACELWYMLNNTDPDLVKICFDVQWTHQGFGYSNLGMLNLMEHLFPRINSFHVRQTRDGAFWPEFGEGDIDYQAWLRSVRHHDWKGMVVLEQCRNESSPADPDFWQSQINSVRALARLLS